MQCHHPTCSELQPKLLAQSCIHSLSPMSLNCKEGGTFENLNFQGILGFNRSVSVLQRPTWTCLILDVSCDNSPAKHFEIGFLHSFGGRHLIWAQCDQQTFIGSPMKEALLLIIASTRVSSYRPPIMVMPLSTLFVQEVPAPILLSKAPLLQPQRSWSMRSMAKYYNAPLETKPWNCCQPVVVTGITWIPATSANHIPNMKHDNGSFSNACEKMTSQRQWKAARRQWRSLMISKN